MADLILRLGPRSAIAQTVVFGSPDRPDSPEPTPSVSRMRWPFARLTIPREISRHASRWAEKLGCVSDITLHSDDAKLSGSARRASRSPISLCAEVVFRLYARLATSLLVSVVLSDPCAERTGRCRRVQQQLVSRS